MRGSFLPLRIGWRLLRAPKSHSAVTAVAWISIVGVAVATAAMICVLSVFNGFRSLLSDRLDLLSTDVIVTPEKGKVFADGDSLADVIRKIPGVEEAMPSMTDKALVIAEGKEMPVTLKGVVPEIYSRISGLDSIYVSEEPAPDFLSGEAAVAVGVAQRLGIFSTGLPMLVFAPKREGRVNVANPAASFYTDSLTIGNVFQTMESNYDADLVIADISKVRDLFQYDTEASSVEVSAASGVSSERLAGKISDVLGPGYVVKDRARQQEMNFRMVAIEKWVTFLLLAFILLIASFNIISTLCMLVIEKDESISIYSSLGMNRGRIGLIFWWESLYVSLIGGLSGLGLGLLLSFLQEWFGFIRLGGDPDAMIIHAYPVKVEWPDIFYTLIPVAVIGIVTAFIAYTFAKSRVRQTI